MQHYVKNSFHNETKTKACNQQAIGSKNKPANCSDKH